MARRLAKIAAGLILAVVVALGMFAAWRLYDRDPEIRAADVAPTPELVARGEYLVKAADCAACHSVPGGKPFAGGLAFPLPFGTIWSTNITPDKDTGIGNWSDDDFVRALHEGVAKDGSHLYPAFPYTSYTGLSRDDAVAMKAWLFTVAPVNAPARPNGLSFPFNQRWTLAFWNFVFLDHRRFHADPAATGAQNRGAYLATALGHCGECHTPRDAGFAMETGRQFGGAQLQGWRAYNITSDPYGIGGWPDGGGGGRQLAISHGGRHEGARGLPAAGSAPGRHAWHTDRSRPRRHDRLRRLGAGFAGPEDGSGPADFRGRLCQLSQLERQGPPDGLRRACRQPGRQRSTGRQSDPGAALGRRSQDRARHRHHAELPDRLYRCGTRRCRELRDRSFRR